MILPEDVREQIREDVQKGYIKERPNGHLTLYNYTQQAQNEKYWPEHVMMCRGLIVDPDWRIVARPFKKFFNVGEEPGDVWYREEPSELTEKLDGSLGILYGQYANGVRIATRGSFDSDQAQWATEWLDQTYPGITPPEGVTPLFEIIYPENRIVVDYGLRSELVLLTGIDNETGRDVNLDDWWPGNKRKTYTPEEAAMLPDDASHEGYVIRYLSDDYRVKVKFPEYLRLHKIVTGTTARTIWEYLALDLPMEELMERVPDEFLQWVNETIRRLEKQYVEILDDARTEFEEIIDLNEQGRKEFALAAQQKKYPGLLFALLDGKPIDKQIWKMIYPAHEIPYRGDV